MQGDGEIPIPLHFSRHEKKWKKIDIFLTKCYYVGRKEGIGMLTIEHLTKRYGERPAVDDLSLHIAPGEIYGFIGHNGAGKTTTLKSVAGILKYDGGTITVDGISLAADPIACKRKIAYIPDNPDIYENLTGIAYLNFICDI